MKTTGWRSLILYIIGAGFLVGIIFFICSYFIQGGSWAIRPSNAHITNNGQLTYSGEITDRDSIHKAGFSRIAQPEKADMHPFGGGLIV